MSKQKTFWGTYTTDKRHLWTASNRWAWRTACGLAGLSEPSRKGDKCKNCLRAIKN